MDLSRVLVAPLAGTVLLCVPVHALASERELTYSAPQGCPTREELTGRLDAQAPDRRDARIHVHSVAGGFRGELVVDGQVDGREEKARLERAVEARTCSAVIDALALMVALDQPAASQAEPRVEVATASDSPLTPSSVAPTQRDLPEAAPSKPARRAVELAMGAEVLGGTPFNERDGVIGGALYAEVFTSLQRAPRVDVGVRASVYRTLPASMAPRAGVTPEVGVTHGALELCPRALVIEHGRFALGVVPCWRAEVGALTVGAKADAASSQDRLWLATGLAERTRLSIRAGDLQPFVELGLSLVAPLVRERFRFDRGSAQPIIADSLVVMFIVGGGVSFP